MESDEKEEARVFDVDLGMEFFDRRMFYALDRKTRGELAVAWKAYAPVDRETRLAADLFEQYVGAVEDVLWGARKQRLCRQVLEVAQARRDEREKFRTQVSASEDAEKEIAQRIHTYLHPVRTAETTPANQREYSQQKWTVDDDEPVGDPADAVLDDPSEDGGEA